MSSIFCTSCGAKMDFAGVKPKFCSSCGSSMMPNETSQQSSTRKPMPTARTEASTSEDETNYDRVPNISKLEYECDYEGLVKKHNLGSLIDEKGEEGQTVQRRAHKTLPSRGD